MRKRIFISITINTYFTSLKKQTILLMRKKTRYLKQCILFFEYEDINEEINDIFKYICI